MAGDPRLVESLVANLVDNGLRHNLPGGRVEVATAAAAGRAQRSATPEPVVAAGEVERLFQPLQRGTDRTAAARPATGSASPSSRRSTAPHGAAFTARIRPEGGLEIDVRSDRAGY